MSAKLRNLHTSPPSSRRWYRTITTVHLYVCQFKYYFRDCRLMFQSERSSRQSLQFLRPAHQNFNLISSSGRFSLIFCPIFMARIQFPPHELRIDCKFQCQAVALTLASSFRTRSFSFFFSPNGRPLFTKDVCIPFALQ